MACRDEGQGRDHDAGVIRDQQQKIDKLTRMVCTILGEFPNVAGATAEIADWWRDHQAADKRRRDDEENEKRREEGRRRDRIAQLEDELADLKRKR